MKSKLSFLSIPYVVWMALFVVAPIVMVVFYAFSSGDGVFTLSNFANMGTYTVVFTRSFRLAAIATVICVLIGYPVSYMMSKEGPGFQRLAMILIMLPMWINFLLRTYSWMSILDNNGIGTQQEVDPHGQHDQQHGNALKAGPFLGHEIGHGVADEDTKDGGDEGQLERAAENHRVGTQVGEVLHGEAAGVAGKGVHHHHNDGRNGKQRHPDHIGDGQKGELILHRRPPDPLHRDQWWRR